MARTGAAAPQLDEELDLGPEDEEVDADEGQATADGEGDADGGQDDDVAEDEEGESEEEGDVEPPRRRRAGETIRSLRQRSQAAERELAEHRRELAELRTRTQQPAFDPAAAARAEAEEIERISLLPPVEQTQALLAKVRRENQQQIAQVELRGFDRSDKTAFEALRARDKFADRKADEVERILGQRRQGGDYSLGRTDILDFLRGREMRARATTDAPRQRAAAKRRVQGQTTRPSRTGGDVAWSGRNARDEDAARTERLKNARIGDIWS